MGLRALLRPRPFTPDDFARLADRLARLEGRFILTLNDLPETREIFSRFRIEEARVTYTTGAGSPKRGMGELIVTSTEGEEGGDTLPGRR